jgi:hypothetical protein
MNERYMITWIEQTDSGPQKGADPTPYPTREMAEEEAKKLYPDRECQIIPFPDLDPGAAHAGSVG